MLDPDFNPLAMLEDCQMKTESNRVDIINIAHAHNNLSDQLANLSRVVNMMGVQIKNMRIEVDRLRAQQYYATQPATKDHS